MSTLLTIGMLIHATLSALVVERTTARTESSGLGVEFRYVLVVVAVVAVWATLSTIIPDPPPPPYSPWPDPWPVGWV